MSDRIKILLRKVGIEAYRYTVNTSTGAQLQKLIEFCAVDLVVDVGANRGQYAKGLRANGYSGRIISFEPLASVRGDLAIAARGDMQWRIADQMALGETEGEITINVAGNSLSSSVLEMLPEHEHAAPGSAYVSSESVSMRRLDGIADVFLADARRVWLKIDTQGYEDRVLNGARGVLPKVMAVQCELSLVPLYAGQLLFDEMRSRMEAMGFVLFAVLPGYVNEQTGQTLQVDGVFVRLEIARSAR